MPVFTANVVTPAQRARQVNTLDAATWERTMAGRGKGANRGGWEDPGLTQAFLARDGGDLLRDGTGAAGGSQAYLGPRARAAPGT